jgi:hypothetical protein
VAASHRALLDYSHAHRGNLYAQSNVRNYAERKLNTMTTIDLERKDFCTESLRKTIVRTRDWRLGLKSRYPEDPRLDKAAATLDKISTQVGELSDEAWLAIEPHFDWCSSSWANAVSLAARRVEYSHEVRTFSQFVNTLISILRVAA